MFRKLNVMAHDIGINAYFWQMMMRASASVDRAANSLQIIHAQVKCCNYNQLPGPLK